MTRIIVALDFDTPAGALELVSALGDTCDFYKVGLQLFTAGGPGILERLRGLDKEVFLDLKLHDIPNTVRGAARRAAEMGASLITVHSSGGTQMVRAAHEGVHGASAGGSSSDATGVAGSVRCAVLAVTVLTSLDAAALASSWGREDALHVDSEVSRLARLARAGGADGLVCSGQEAAAVRAEHGSALRILVPGVRRAGADSHDQSRVVTPAGAVRAGADYIVIGRAVTAAADPVAEMQEIRREVDQA